MRYSKVMDVLVEMAPGAGWLAREGDRIVFLPGAESVDTAHDVIEPLLIPREVDESFDTMRGWIEGGLPLPQMMLVSLEPSVRILNHRITDLSMTQSPKHETEPVQTSETEVVDLGAIANLIAHDEAEEASGMLVEGVVRASGLRLHFHRGWGADGLRDTDVQLPTSFLEIELGDRRLAVGNGLVLGRWPYSHPEFDEALEPLILNDPAVSRLHAIITPTAEGDLLSDQHSHNGTWVIRPSGESQKVEPESPQVLTTGDQIRIGDTVMAVL